jgi:hypothetical protein
MKKTIALASSMLALVLVLCACGNSVDTPAQSASSDTVQSVSNTTQFSPWEVASDVTAFGFLYADKLTEYAGYLSPLAEHIEEFGVDVQNGKSLTDNLTYTIIRAKFLAWCYGVDSYPEESVFPLVRNLYNAYAELSSLTHEFVDQMDTVSNIEDMAVYVQSFTTEGQAIVNKITQLGIQLADEIDDTNSTTTSGNQTQSSGKSSNSSTSTTPKNNSQSQSTGKYWCMGKNDTCQNKTSRPDDFFCDQCDPNGDNIEG